MGHCMDLFEKRLGKLRKGNLEELRHAFYCQIFSIPVSLPLKLLEDVNNFGTAHKQEKYQFHLPTF